MQSFRYRVLVAGLAGVFSVGAHAQQVTGTPGSPGATTTIPRLFDYMEVFYNHQRRHSTINYVTPLAFEESTRA